MGRWENSYGISYHYLQVCVDRVRSYDSFYTHIVLETQFKLSVRFEKSSSGHFPHHEKRHSASSPSFFPPLSNCARTTDPHGLPIACWLLTSAALASILECSCQSRHRLGVERSPAAGATNTIAALACISVLNTNAARDLKLLLLY